LLLDRGASSKGRPLAERALPTRRVRFKETEYTPRQNVLVIGSTAPAEAVAKHNSPSPRELGWLIPLVLLSRST
jgi:hypothetical protein